MRTAPASPSSPLLVLGTLSAGSSGPGRSLAPIWRRVLPTHRSRDFRRGSRRLETRDPMWHTWQPCRCVSTSYPEQLVTDNSMQCTGRAQ